MFNDTAFERKRIKDRLREVFILCGFIITAALITTVIMDLLVYPAVIFSIKNKAVFNYIVKDLFWIVILSAVLLIMAKRVYDLKKDGFSASAIMKHIGLRISGITASAFIIIIIACGVITVIYLLLNYNYYMLYKITNL